jgi:hypothetical protein
MNEDTYEPIQPAGGETVGAVQDASGVAIDQRLRIEALIRRKNVTPVETANANIQRIHPSFKRAGFLEFFFVQSSRIRRFSLNTKLLKFVLFPPSFRMNFGQVREILSGAFKHAQTLQPVLAALQERGWRTMTKFDYNLIGLLKRFCDALMTMVGDDPQKTPKFENHFKNMQNLYLACRHQPEFVTHLSSILQSELKNFRDNEEIAIKSQEAVQKLLLDNDMKPGLMELILAGDMLESRRFIERSDLQLELPGGVVSNFHMAAPAGVQSAIMHWEKESMDLLARLALEKEQNRHIQGFIQSYVTQPDEFTRDYDFRTLGEFIAPTDKGGKNLWLKIRDDAVQTAFAFYPLLVQTFEKFLTDKLEIEDVGPVRCFPADYFQREFEHIRRDVDRLTLNNFQCPNMARKDFLAFRSKDRRVSAGSGQVGMIQLLEELSNPVFTIGLRLATLHLHHQNPEVPLDRWFPKSPNAGQIQKEIDEVFWNKPLGGQGVLRGQNFGNLVARIANLCLLASLYYSNRDMLDFLDNIHRLDRSIQELKQSLERIADVLTWDDLSRKYAGV